MRYLRENEKSTTVEYNVSLLHEKICWYDLFSGYCSEKTSRACKLFYIFFNLPFSVIWALASMHPKIRGKHLRAWAHILQVEFLPLCPIS